MLLIKSPYPDPPFTSDLNAVQFLWNHSDRTEWPEDLTMYIDARTGCRRTYQEFRERVHLVATMLTTSASEGGLGIRVGEDGEIVGIMSQNSMVSPLRRRCA
jgi:hypothetical protein